MYYLLLILLVFAFALQALRAKRLIESALCLAVVSGLISIVLFVLGAHQVAAIELSVGAGLVTVLFVFAIGIAGEERVSSRSVVPRSVAAVGVIITAFLLSLSVFPADAVPSGTAEESLSEVLWQQRSLDILVQIVLIFSGVLGILGLLAEARAPLDKAVAESVAEGRERELLALQEQVLEREKELA